MMLIGVKITTRAFNRIHSFQSAQLGRASFRSDRWRARSLQMALGLAKEGFLGSRGSLALSILDTFLRPRFAGSVPGPFFRTQAQGVNVGWNYSLSNVDAFSINYGFSRSVTEYSLALPTSVTGATASTLRSESSSPYICVSLVTGG